MPKNNQENSNTISNGISDDGNTLKNNNNFIVVNQKDMDDRKPLYLNDLKDINGNEIIIDLLFIRYKKLFFIMKYSSKPLKADFNEMLAY